MILNISYNKDDYLHDIGKEVRDLAIKEMPIEEKYDKLFNTYALLTATNYAFHKEQGTLKKWQDYRLEAYRRYMGPMIELMKKFARTRDSKTFKHAINQVMYMEQVLQPLSVLELTWVSDREAVMRNKNCEDLRRRREMVKKAGLNINPREICTTGIAMHTSAAKELGIDIHVKLEENGCKWTMKLK